MSEYQYYEWQTIDRPLTAREQVDVDWTLQSHGHRHFHPGNRYLLMGRLQA